MKNLKLKHIFIIFAYTMTIVGIAYDFITPRVTLKGLITVMSFVGVFFHLVQVIGDNWNKKIF